MTDDGADGRASLKEIWQAHFLALEWFSVVVLSLSLIGWGELLNGAPGVDRFLDDHKQELYTALASVAGALLGFVIATTSIVIGFATSEKLEPVRESEHYQDLWETLLSGTKFLGAVTLGALVGLVLDGPAELGRGLFYGMLFTAGVAAARLLRTIWILRKVVGLL